MNEKIRIDKNLVIALCSLYEAVAESKGVIDIHIDTTTKEINFKESFPKEERKDDLEIQKDIDLETLTLILNLRSIF